MTPNASKGVNYMQKAILQRYHKREKHSIEFRYVKPSDIAVFQHLKKLELSTDHTLKVIAAQAWPEEGQIFIEKAGAGVDVF